MFNAVRSSKLKKFEVTLHDCFRYPCIRPIPAGTENGFKVRVDAAIKDFFLDGPSKAAGYFGIHPDREGLADRGNTIR